MVHCGVLSPPKIITLRFTNELSTVHYRPNFEVARAHLEDVDSALKVDTFLLSDSHQKSDGGK